MNVVTLVGNLATDVELRDFGDEKRLATFRLAVDRGGKDDEADFFRISVWDRQAQACADHLGKGSKVAVEGRLRTSSWEDNGEKRSRVEGRETRRILLARDDLNRGGGAVRGGRRLESRRSRERRRPGARR
jgi:single stranded DNA-binding protein